MKSKHLSKAINRVLAFLLSAAMVATSSFVTPVLADELNDEAAVEETVSEAASDEVIMTEEPIAEAVGNTAGEEEVTVEPEPELDALEPNMGSGTGTPADSVLEIANLDTGKYSSDWSEIEGAPAYSDIATVWNTTAEDKTFKATAATKLVYVKGFTGYNGTEKGKSETEGYYVYVNLKKPNNVTETVNNDTVVAWREIDYEVADGDGFTKRDNKYYKDYQNSLFGENGVYLLKHLKLGEDGKPQNFTITVDWDGAGGNTYGATEYTFDVSAVKTLGPGGVEVGSLTSAAKTDVAKFNELKSDDSLKSGKVEVDFTDATITRAEVPGTIPVNDITVSQAYTITPQKKNNEKQKLPYITGFKSFSSVEKQQNGHYIAYMIGFGGNDENYENAKIYLLSSGFNDGFRQLAKFDNMNDWSEHGKNAVILSRVENAEKVEGVYKLQFIVDLDGTGADCTLYTIDLSNVELSDPAEGQFDTVEVTGLTDNKLTLERNSYVGGETSILQRLAESHISLKIQNGNLNSNNVNLLFATSSSKIGNAVSSKKDGTYQVLQIGKKTEGTWAATEISDKAITTYEDLYAHVTRVIKNDDDVTIEETIESEPFSIEIIKNKYSDGIAAKAEIEIAEDTKFDWTEKAFDVLSSDKTTVKITTNDGEEFGKTGESGIFNADAEGEITTLKTPFYASLANIKKISNPKDGDTAYTFEYTTGRYVGEGENAVFVPGDMTVDDANGGKVYIKITVKTYKYFSSSSGKGWHDVSSYVDEPCEGTAEITVKHTAEDIKVTVSSTVSEDGYNRGSDYLDWAKLYTGTDAKIKLSAKGYNESGNVDDSKSITLKNEVPSTADGTDPIYVVSEKITFVTGEEGNEITTTILPEDIPEIDEEGTINIQFIVTKYTVNSKTNKYEATNVTFKPDVTVVKVKDERKKVTFSTSEFSSLTFNGEKLIGFWDQAEEGKTIAEKISVSGGDLSDVKIKYENSNYYFAVTQGEKEVKYNVKVKLTRKDPLSDTYKSDGVIKNAGDYKLSLSVDGIANWEEGMEDKYYGTTVIDITVAKADLPAASKFTLAMQDSRDGLTGWNSATKSFTYNGRAFSVDNVKVEPANGTPDYEAEILNSADIIIKKDSSEITAKNVDSGLKVFLSVKGNSNYNDGEIDLSGESNTFSITKADIMAKTAKPHVSINRIEVDSAEGGLGAVEIQIVGDYESTEAQNAEIFAEYLDKEEISNISSIQATVSTQITDLSYSDGKLSYKLASGFKSDTTENKNKITATVELKNFKNIALTIYVENKDQIASISADDYELKGDIVPETGDISFKYLGRGLTRDDFKVVFKNGYEETGVDVYTENGVRLGGIESIVEPGTYKVMTFAKKGEDESEVNGKVENTITVGAQDTLALYENRNAGLEYGGADNAKLLKQFIAQSLQYGDKYSPARLNADDITVTIIDSGVSYDSYRVKSNKGKATEWPTVEGYTSYINLSYDAEDDSYYTGQPYVKVDVTTGSTNLADSVKYLVAFDILPSPVADPDENQENIIKYNVDIITVEGGAEIYIGTLEIPAGKTINLLTVADETEYVTQWYNKANNKKWDLSKDVVNGDMAIYGYNDATTEGTAAYDNTAKEIYTYNVLGIPAQVYTGKAIKPAVTVERVDGSGNRTILAKSAYTVTYETKKGYGSDPIKVGTHYFGVTIKASKKNDERNLGSIYEREFSYEIIPANLENTVKLTDKVVVLNEKNGVRTGTIPAISTITVGKTKFKYLTDYDYRVEFDGDVDEDITGVTYETKKVKNVDTKTGKINLKDTPTGNYRLIIEPLNQGTDAEEYYTLNGSYEIGIDVQAQKYQMSKATVTVLDLTTGKKTTKKDYSDDESENLLPVSVKINGKEYIYNPSEDSWTGGDDGEDIGIYVDYDNAWRIGKVTVNVWADGSGDNGYIGLKTATYTLNAVKKYKISAKTNDAKFNPANGKFEATSSVDGDNSKAVKTTFFKNLAKFEVPYKAKGYTLEEVVTLYLESLNRNGKWDWSDGGCGEVITKAFRGDGTDFSEEDFDWFNEVVTTSYKNNIKPGTATVTLTARPGTKYSGSFNITFKIAKRNIASDVFNYDEYEDKGIYFTKQSGVKVYSEYNEQDKKVSETYYIKQGGLERDSKGKLVIPADTASEMLYDASLGRHLVPGTDFTLSYTKNAARNNPNEVVITIKGKGNYAGTNKKFKQIIITTRPATTE